MKIYIVGGAVRDRLLGVTPKDIDYVVVGSTPKQMLDIGFKQVSSNFPVFLEPTTNDEYALARQERKVGSGYNGFDVDYDSSVTLEQDLLRRDLTMNAIALDPDTDEYIDPYNGMQDIKDGIIRHVSDAYAEDPLRVLRTARFEARYGFKIHKSTRVLMSQLVTNGEISKLTQERVLLELEKVIIEPYLTKFFLTLNECGAADVWFPELFNSGKFLPSIHDHLCSIQFDQKSLPDSSHKLAYMLSALDLVAYNSLSHRLGISNRMNKIIRSMIAILEFNHNIDYTETLYDLMVNLDAYRQPDVFHQSINWLSHYIGGSTRRKLCKNLMVAYAVSSRINFNSLPKIQRDTLKGHDISLAINSKRSQEVKNIINTLN